MSYVERQGVRLFYECSGAGSPPLVFVHGFCCTHHDWQHQVGFFSSRQGVVTCDLRGHGVSDHTPEQCSIETFGMDIKALLDDLDLPPSVLIGHSMGCRVVLQAALEAPDRTAGVVFVDGSRIAEGSPEELEQAVRQRMQSEGYTAMMQRLFAEMFLPGADATLKERIIAQALATPQAVGEQLFPRLCGWDARHMDAALARLTVPVLVLQSTHLNTAHVRVALRPGETTPWMELVRRHCPSAQVEVVGGVGHFPMLEAPEAVNRAIATFVDHVPHV